MPTVSAIVCCQEIPEEEGKLRELDVQSTVSQIMRGLDQFAWTDGCCKQSHRKCTTSIAKTVKPMDLHTIIVLSSPYSHVDVWISFKSVVIYSYISYPDTMIHGSRATGKIVLGISGKKYKSCAVI